MGSYVLDLREIDQTRVAVVGGKGAHLGELSRIRGLRVPAGFCGTTDAFRRIMAEEPSIDDRLQRLARLEPDDREAIGALSAEIRLVLERIAIPDDLAAAITGALARLGEHTIRAGAPMATIELMEPLDASDLSNAVARRLAKSGEGFYHLAVEVADVQASGRALEQHGLTILRRPATSGQHAPRWLVHPKSATGGMGGLTGIPPARVLGVELISPAAYLALTLVCTLGCVLVLLALVRSPFGRALKALRDDETAAIALGKHPVMLRLIATTIGGAMAAIGGSLYAFYVSFVNPESFTLDYSVLLMAMVIIGGAGSLLGPGLGALFITVFPALLNFLQVPSSVLGPVQQIVYGMMIVLLMLFMPEGLVSAGKLLSRRGR